MADTTPKQDFSAVGKAAQILPAYLRIICRSRFDCTPVELLEISQTIALDSIDELKEAGMSYRFLDEHRAIISEVPPADILALIEGRIGTDNHSPLLARMIGTCPLQQFNGPMKTAKSKCWSCSIIPELIRELKAKTKTEEAPNCPPINRVGISTDEPAPLKPSPFKRHIRE